MSRTRSGLIAVLALVVLLLTPLLALTAAPAGAAPAGDRATFGSSSAKAQQLKQGCRSYRFRYRITAPGEDWMAELTLVSPSGAALASHTFKRSAGDPARDTRRFRVCSASTTPGRHTITMLVTSYGYRDETSRRSEPTHFRLTRR